MGVMFKTTIDMNPTAMKNGMALAAAFAFLLGTIFALNGDTTQAVSQRVSGCDVNCPVVSRLLAEKSGTQNHLTIYVTSADPL